MIIEAAKRKRFLTFIIDIITISVLMAITIIVEESIDYKMPMKVLRLAIILGGYYIPLEFFFGKTLGKFITKTKVVNKYGGKISFRESIIRYLCRWLPFEFLSLGLGVDAKAWHDLLSKTHVIDEKMQEEMSEKISSIG